MESDRIFKMLLTIFVVSTIGIIVYAITCEMYKKSTEKEVSRESIGKIVDVQAIPTPSRHCPEIQIKTEEQVMVIRVRRYPKIKLGVEAWEVHYNTGRCGITWEGSKYVYF